MDEGCRRFPDQPNKPYDIKDTCSRSRRPVLLRVQAGYAPNIVVGGRLGGRPVGIVANQPAPGRHLDIARPSRPRASFALRRFTPLVTFVDVPGSLPGTAQGSALSKHGAKLLYAYCEATVPKLTVIAQGLRRRLRRHVLKHQRAPTLPTTAEIAVMGPDGRWASSTAEMDAAKDPARLRKDEGPQVPRSSRTRTRPPRRGYIDAVIEPGTPSPAHQALGSTSGTRAAAQAREYSTMNARPL
jgi:propionyl-CoA carboxylase beta chain